MHILCFGDSNTYGFDPACGLGGRYDAANRWVDLLAEKSGFSVRNRGENGREIPHTPAAILKAQQTVRANKAADLFLVMLGTNDLLHGASAFQCAERMEHFLKEILPFCNNILLVAPPPLCRGEWVTDEKLLSASAALGEALRAVARSLGIDFADAADWGVSLASDGVHFTKEGNRAFAQGLFEHLLPRSIGSNT